MMADLFLFMLKGSKSNELDGGIVNFQSGFNLTQSLSKDDF